MLEYLDRVGASGKTKHELGAPNAEEKVMESG